MRKPYYKPLTIAHILEFVVWDLSTNLKSLNQMLDSLEPFSRVPKALMAKFRVNLLEQKL
jgi:hypothetical protein